MIKLKVINNENNLITLKDINNYEYKLIFEFHDVNININIDDIVYINESLLDCTNEMYSYLLAVGPLESKYGKEIKTINDKDLIVINNTILKKLYG